MKLYHYSKEKFESLLTKERQGPISDIEREKAAQDMLKYSRPGMYFEHISLFLEIFMAKIIMVGRTSGYYLLVKTRPNYEALKKQYAGSVPHVMIYPDKGEIKYDHVTIVKVK